MLLDLTFLHFLHHRANELAYFDHAKKSAGFLHRPNAIDTVYIYIYIEVWGVRKLPDSLQVYNHLLPFDISGVGTLRMFLARHDARRLGVWENCLGESKPQPISHLGAMLDCASLFFQDLSLLSLLFYLMRPVFWGDFRWFFVTCFFLSPLFFARL